MENETPEPIEVQAPKLNKFKEFFKDPKKRLWTIIIGSAAIALIAIGLGLFFMLHEKTTPKGTSDAAVNTPPQPTDTSQLYESPLDGTKTTDKAATERHPLAILVENHPDARPQSGLDQASIVYEALAEGGITRFMAIYGTNQADKVGPIRSARTYFVDWAEGYNAYLAHVGGNIDALDKIKADHVLDLDQFALSAPYHREYRAGLALEHTMYASTTKLWEAATTKKFATANTFTTYEFKDDPTTDAEKALLPESQKVSVTFSSAAYNVYFQYDKATNSYKRFVAGQPHNDGVTKKQINPKNIIVISLARKDIKTRINEAGLQMSTVGSGTAKFFLDGKMIEGKWSKTSSSAREKFTDTAGSEIVFNRGQSWICVVPPETGLGVTVQ